MHMISPANRVRHLAQRPPDARLLPTAHILNQQLHLAARAVLLHVRGQIVAHGVVLVDGEQELVERGVLQHRGVGTQREGVELAVEQARGGQRGGGARESALVQPGGVRVEYGEVVDGESDAWTAVAGLGAVETVRGQWV